MLSSVVSSLPSILFMFEELCPYIYIYMFDSLIYMFWIHGKVPMYTFICSCFEIVGVLKGVLQFSE